MAFYKDFTKKKMTRADHLRSDGKWEEEGTRYRKSTAQADKQRRENDQDRLDDRKRPGKPGNRFDAPKGRDFKKDKPFDGPRKNDFKKPAPRPDRPERFDRPAPKPAPKPEYRPNRNRASRRKTCCPAAIPSAKPSRAGGILKSCWWPRAI